VYGSIGPIINCIIWQNAAPDYPQLGPDENPVYCCIQDWTGGGTGNISEDPLFTTGPLGPWYLAHRAAGQAANSPCINSGGRTAASLGFSDLSTRTDGWPDSGQVDMGYHYPASPPRSALRNHRWPLYR
jgi:hypothetical protein